MYMAQLERWDLAGAFRRAPMPVLVGPLPERRLRSRRISPPVRRAVVAVTHTLRPGNVTGS